jgi:hypothetical protein
VDDEFILIVGLNFGLQLHATHVIGAIKGVSKVSRIQRAVNVDAGAACCGFERGVYTLLHPTKGRFALIFWMHGVCEVYRLIIQQQKHIRPPRNAMILSLTLHTRQKFTAVLTGKKIGTDHTETKIHLCANINTFFGSLRTRSI